MPGMLAPTGSDSLLKLHSDTRSGQIIEDRVRPVLEAGSTVRGKKPVLLLVDEIDGATGAGENVGGSLQPRRYSD